MNTKLIKGLSKQEAEELRASMLAALPAFEKITELLTEKQRVTESQRRKRSNYFMSRWASYQADCNGYLRALDEVKHLIKPDQG